MTVASSALADQLQLAIWPGVAGFEADISGLSQQTRTSILNNTTAPFAFFGAGEIDNSRIHQRRAARLSGHHSGSPRVLGDTFLPALCDRRRSIWRRESKHIDSTDKQ